MEIRHKTSRAVLLEVPGESLRRANLCGKGLQLADFEGADLRGADLEGADLRGADLTGADLRGADLTGADLREADLQWADLERANLRGADLRGTNLQGACLIRANLRGAELPPFQIPQGELIGWGKKACVLVRLRIPHAAKRTGSLVGRKCRAQFAWVDWTATGESVVVRNQYAEATVYSPGEQVWPHKYCDDARVECAPGIHFFLTREEAENW